MKKFTVACSCRKPSPGMLLQAARNFGLDLTRCFMVGDKPDDIEVVHRVGGKGVHVQTKKHQKFQQADHLAENLIHAAEWIMGEVRK